MQKELLTVQIQKKFVLFSTKKYHATFLNLKVTFTT